MTSPQQRVVFVISSSLFLRLRVRHEHCCNWREINEDTEVCGFQLSFSPRRPEPHHTHGRDDNWALLLVCLYVIPYPGVDEYGIVLGI